MLVSQDSIQTMIIKEEGLEAFPDQASPESVPYADDLGLDNDNDPDYQVDLTYCLFFHFILYCIYHVVFY